MVLEMKEQIRLWFYAQLFMSVVLTGEAPYKAVVDKNLVDTKAEISFFKNINDNILNLFFPNFPIILIYPVKIN